MNLSMKKIQRMNYLLKEVYAILNELVKEEVRRLIADEKLDQTAVNLMKSVH